MELMVKTITLNNCESLRRRLLKLMHRSRRKILGMFSNEVKTLSATTAKGSMSNRNCLTHNRSYHAP